MLPLAVDTQELEDTINELEKIDRNLVEMFRDARTKLKTATDQPLGPAPA